MVSTTRSERDFGRWVPLVVAIGGFAVLVSLTIRNGFNPTDEGLIVGYAHRLLNGDVPHRDFIFSRPVGSSLLHTIDVLLPTPLLMTGRVIDAAQIFVYTLCLGCLTVDRRVRDAHPLLLAAVVVAAVINVHSLPLMAWYTVDGLFLIAVGVYWLRNSPRFWVRCMALVMLGYAPLTKQSFFLGPLLALWFLWRYRRDDMRGLARLARTLALLALPGTLYLAYVVVRHGLGSLLDQFKGVAPVYGQQLVSDLVAPSVNRGWAILALVVIVGAWLLIGVSLRTRSRADDGSGTITAPIAAPLAARISIGAGTVVLLVATGNVVWAGQFDLGHPYGTHLMVLALVTSVAMAIVRRRIPEGVLLVVASGWMAALSIGYPRVNFVAGSLVLAILAPLWQAAVLVIDPNRFAPQWPARRRVFVMSAVGLVVMVVVGLPFINLRNRHLYRDLPADQLTADLGEIHPDLAGVRTNPMTAQYLRALSDCVAAAGTKRVVLATDNPALYPVFDLHSPLPTIAMYPQEFAGSDQRMIESFDGLNNATEKTVVIWQTFPVETLSTRRSIPDATLNSVIFYHSSPVLLNGFHVLQGKKSACGPFIIITLGPGT